MFKTIFRKQFFASILTITLSLIFLGFAFSSLFEDYVLKEKITILENQGNKIANGILSPYLRYLDHFIMPPSVTNQIREELRTLLEYLDVSLAIIDTGFSVIIYSDNLDPNVSGKILDMSGLKDIESGETITIIGNWDGLFTEDVLTVGCPIMADGKFRGAVLINTSMSDINNSLQEVFKITSVCLLAAGAISFIFIFITSKTITKPINQINEAAKVIADGNFDRRIDVMTKDEIGQLAESFNYMAESLDKQEKHRKEFMDNISHDIRSPLTSIKGFLQAIIDGTIPPEKTERYLNIALEETERLSKLANDLLDISKIDAVEVTLNKTYFDLNELIRKTIIIFENRITDKKINFNVIFADEKSIVYADKEKIQRIIYNLLDNAIKFTEKNGNIIIESSRKDGKIYVSIKDDGKGIAAEEQKRIFERFYKVDSSRGEDKKGSGLGLAIVKEFVKAHDETVTLKSEIDKGAEFIFSLQLQEEVKK